MITVKEKNIDSLLNALKTLYKGINNKGRKEEDEYIILNFLALFRISFILDYSIHNKSVTLTALGGGWGAKTGLYWIPCITPERINKRQNGQRFKPSNSKFYTLTATDKHGVLMNGKIRKLTPLECERLQTLPDNYTEGISNTQRYKTLGNGWTVDVIAHIFRGLKNVLGK